MKSFGVLLRVAWLLALMTVIVSCGQAPAQADGEVGSVNQRVCSGGSLVSNVPSYTAIPGTPAVVRWTASASCQTVNPEYAFWLYQEGSGWTQVQPFGASPTWDWTTTGATPGHYAVNVWIREAGSSAYPLETYGGQDFYLNAGPSCTGATVSASPSSPSPGPVTFTAGSSTCNSPQYKFWIAAPGQGYTLARDWGGATFNWPTNGLPLGQYSISVWVKDSGSSANASESTAQMYYTLAASPGCTAGTVTASPNTPSTGTNPVTLTASASSCTTAQYKFYIAPPGGPYSLVRDWGGATYNWDTSALTPGTYSISVWISSLGSGQSETTAQMYYSVLGGSACTSSTVGGTPSGPQPLGTQIAVTAQASGCSNPEYKFYMLKVGGPYVLVRDWGGATYNWDTSTLTSGTYSFSVWTRNIGSPLSNEATAQSYFVLTYNSTTNDVKNFTAGLFHTCTVRGDGTVDCWGSNSDGQIGDGTNNDALVPTPVPGITGATKVATGYNHTCAIVSGGAVSCWGQGSNGQLGNGSTSGSLTPVSVTGITGATAIAAGTAHTCALLGDGTVKCWGYSSQGAIGTLGISSTPVTVSGITGAVGVSAGYYHSCALLSSGQVKCWGGNGNGQLGNGTNSNSVTPVTVSGLQDVTSLLSSSDRNCALMANHTVHCWGYNANGGNGDGTTSASNVPTTVSGITNASAISISPDTGCAALLDGTAKCWGLNTNGGLGNGNTTDSPVPVAVAGLTGATVTAVATGWRHSCALFADNTVNCWGWGVQGELGNNGRASSLTPVVATLP